MRPITALFAALLLLIATPALAGGPAVPTGSPRDLVGSMSLPSVERRAAVHTARQMTDQVRRVARRLVAVSAPVEPTVVASARR